MSFNIPDSPKVIVDRMKATLKSELPDSNPFLERSLIAALCASYGGAVYEAYLKLEIIINNFFPQDATGEFLDQWGEILNIYRKSSTQASGYFTVNGIDGSIIPDSSTPGAPLLINQNGNTYQVVDSVTVNQRTVEDVSYSYTDPFINFIFDDNHLLATGITIDVSGFDQASLNTQYQCFVIDETTIQIVVGSITPPTGNPQITTSTASVEILSQEYGINTNLESGSPVTFSNLLSGVNQTGYVQYSEIAGGADLESDDEYRKRVVYAWQNPGTPFSVPAIRLKALEVPGVTRVFITPQTGKVTVYFTMDNNVNNIPPQSVVDSVKEKLNEIRDAGLYPDNRFIVSAPIAVPVNFIFTSLTPNTGTMRQAIKDNLNYFFRNEVNVGVSITQNEILCVIQNTIDPVSGQTVQSFILTSPVSGVTLNEGEIAILGNINI